jgi:DNA polymerase-1
MTLPKWWSDIIRSGEHALEEYEHVLNLLEKMMTEEQDLSPSAVHRNAARWSELIMAAEAAAGRLADSRRLADARRRDVEAAGLSSMDLSILEERASRAATRGSELAVVLRKRMSETSAELNGAASQTARIGYLSQSDGVSCKLVCINMNDTLYLLDGYGLIYRAYFAFINRPLTDRDGHNVSAVHGFFRAIFALRRSLAARRFVVALDPVGPTFRHEMYPEYKATRDAAPEDLHAQVPLIEEILALLGVPVVRFDGFEADDVIGSLAAICREKSIPCRLVSADKDLMQLVSDEVQMLRPEKGGGFRQIGPVEVVEEKGVQPDQIVDYLALIGDSSDNIPGVSGIGPKTAAALLAEWGTLENLYDNLDKAAVGARLKKLREGRENAFFSKDLVTIRTDMDMAAAWDAFEKTEAADLDADSIAAAVRLFRDRDLRTLADEAEALAGGAASGTPAAAPAAEQPPPHPEVNYNPILTKEEMESWGEAVRGAGMVALDTETDNLDAMRADLVGISISIKAGEAAYLPLRRPDGPCLPQSEVVDWLNHLLADEKIRIIGQNFKYDMKVLRRAGVKLGGAWFDTMIAAWVLDASSPVGMDALADRYLGIQTVSFKDVVPKGKDFSAVTLNEAVRYAAEDADITFRLYEVFSGELEADPKRMAIFRDMEMPLQPILAGMEAEGIGLDIFELEAYGDELGRGIDDLVKEIHGLCGHEFNIASPKQLQTVLFDERGLTPGKKTKTGFSTDNSVLTDLAKEDPVPEKILLYRSLTKLKSTYVDVLPQLVHPDDGRIHTSYSQTGAATGRLSSNNPNLQNIPVRDENGRRIRKAFKSRPGYLFGLGRLFPDRAGSAGAHVRGPGPLRCLPRGSGRSYPHRGAAPGCGSR